ncbi:MAG: FCSD flavin-binding domain-containing protein [Burkholderiales bacterium]|jgi:NADPH-dependent 2,4-dienoyl-CoA reductase/sulfur reductase-like enzyme
MNQWNRRDWLKWVGTGATVTSLAACATSGTSAPKARVVVVGGGYGGATAAKYLRLWGANDIAVTLIEREAQFVSCPMSNLVLGGSRKMQDITVSYDNLRSRHGINVVQDSALAIDGVKKMVRTRSGREFAYDFAIVSPGIEIQFDTVKGYDANAQQTVLHAWKAGAQTAALRQQLEAMPDGGVYVLGIPRAPYRCPPGPYERACQVAHYFKTSKPKSKVLILDGNADITSKAGLFRKAFTEQYGGIIEYRNNSLVTELDAQGKTVTLEIGDKVKGDVLNIVPQMRAGDIARDAGLITANNRWCEVDWLTTESIKVKGVYVLGDATLSAPGMPKSGHMANQHGKTAAAAIIEQINGRSPVAPMMANTCYSYVDDKKVVHVASVHRYVAEKKTMEVVPGSGGLSSAANELEGIYAWQWAQNIWADMLA